jgi:MFS family permease
VLTRPLASLLAAEVISTTGSQMTSLALPWFVLVSTGSAKQMSFVLAGSVAGYALFGIPSGAVLAALGSRRTMMIADAARAPLTALIPILHWTGHLSLGLLVAIAFVLGVLATPYLSAQRVIVPELLGEETEPVARANALFQGATRISMLGGPALAGLLIGFIGAPAVLLVDAATFVAAFLLILAFVPAQGQAPPPVGEDQPSGVFRGVRYLARDRLLRTWTTAFVIGDGSFQVIFAAIPVLVVGHYDANPRLAGILFALLGPGCRLWQRRLLPARRAWARASVRRARVAGPGAPALAARPSGSSVGSGSRPDRVGSLQRPPQPDDPLAVHAQTAARPAPQRDDGEHDGVGEWRPARAARRSAAVRRVGSSAGARPRRCGSDDCRAAHQCRGATRGDDDQPE